MAWEYFLIRARGSIRQPQVHSPRYLCRSFSTSAPVLPRGTWSVPNRAEVALSVPKQQGPAVSPEFPPSSAVSSARMCVYCFPFSLPLSSTRGGLSPPVRRELPHFLRPRCAGFASISCSEFNAFGFLEFRRRSSLSRTLSL